MIFTLFRGQSAIERGFSINSATLDNNMLEHSIIAHRIVCDSVFHMLDSDQQGPRGTTAVHKLDISKEMLKYCRSARCQYRTFSEAQKDEGKRNDSMSSDTERSRALLEIERKKAKTVEKEMAVIGHEADLLALKAQKQNKMDLLVQYNLKSKRVAKLNIELAVTRLKIQTLENAE